MVPLLLYLLWATTRRTIFSTEPIAERAVIKINGRKSGWILIRLCLISTASRRRCGKRFLRIIYCVSVCDVYEDMAKRITDDGRPAPKTYTDYKKCLDKSKPDMVVIATSWDYHLEICLYAMERGIVAACEVGGAYSFQSLWELVRCYFSKTRQIFTTTSTIRVSWKVRK